MNKIIEKYRKFPIQAKASFWFAFCSVLNKCVQFVSIPIFTRLLSQEEYGEYTIFISWQSIILMLVSLNIQSNIFNNMLIKEKDKPDVIIKETLKLTTGIALSLIVICLLFSGVLQNIVQLPNRVVIYLIISSLFTAAFDLWAMKERFDFKYKKLVLVSCLAMIANPVLGLIFVYCVPGDKGLLRIYSVIFTSFLFYVYFYLRPLTNKEKANDKYIRYALSLAIPLLPHYLSQTLLNQSDRIMISNICGKDYAAVYGVAYSLAITLLFFNKALNDSFTPWIYRKLKAKDMSGIFKVSSILVVLVGFLNLMLIAISPELIHILAPTEYEGAVQIVLPVALSSYLIYVYSQFCILEFYYEMKIQMMVISVIGALTNIVLNLILIPVYGYVAAGYTTLVSYILFVSLHYIIVKHTEKKYLSSKPVYDYRFIFIFSVALFALAFGFNTIYKYKIVRYLVFTTLLIICIYIFKRWRNSFDRNR